MPDKKPDQPQVNALHSAFSELLELWQEQITLWYKDPDNEKLLSDFLSLWTAQPKTGAGNSPASPGGPHERKKSESKKTDRKKARAKTADAAPKRRKPGVSGTALRKPAAAIRANAVASKPAKTRRGAGAKSGAAKRGKRRG